MTERPSTRARRRAPAATLAILAALLTSPAWGLRVAQGAAPWPAEPAREEVPGIDVRIEPATRTPFAGEVFDVQALITASGSGGGQVVGSPQWGDAAAGAVATEDWSKPERITVNGRPAIRFRSRAAAATPGDATLPSVAQELRVRGDGTRLGDVVRDRFFSGGFASDLFDDFFAEATTRSVTASSAPAGLDARPLPDPVPAGFSGAVGHFTLDSQVTPATARAGDPLTWTLTLRGTGNWPAGITLPTRSVPAGAQTLKPKTRPEFADGQRFTGSVSEDLVLIPGAAGELHLDPVQFVYFDPTAGSYVTLKADVPPVAVQPAPVQAHGPAVTAPAPSTGRPGAAAAEPASPVPRAPLEGEGRALVPLETSVLLMVAAIPLAGLAALGLWLGSARARARDPLCARRLAAARLASIIAALRTATTPAARARALLDWQRTAACALALPMRAPTSATWHTLPPIPSPVAEEWATLWLESERALHAPRGTLPTDWCERAMCAARDTGLPRFNVLQGLKPRHLFATATAGALIALVAGAAPATAGPLADYQAGNFAAAHAIWLQRAEAAPTDWIARYNLGLTEAQLGNSGRALAETTAAFLLQPRHADVRWNLGAFVDRVPTADANLVALARGTGVAWLARQLSPAAWQMTLLSGVALLASAAALGLHRRHRGTPAGGQQTATAFLPGLVLFAAGAVGMHAYGPLADPDAGIIVSPTAVRSVPTAVAQVERPIGAGGVVSIDRRFLDWVRVTRSDGEQGWVRSAEVLPLFVASPPPTSGAVLSGTSGTSS